MGAARRVVPLRLWASDNHLTFTRHRPHWEKEVNTTAYAQPILTAGYGLAFTISAAIFAATAIVALVALPRTLTPSSSVAADGGAAEAA